MKPSASGGALRAELVGARPVAELGGPIAALLSDVDGTMTTQGRVEGITYVALERLGEAGIPVVLVTGRPAGWGQAFMTVAPVAAVVTENGGVTWVRHGKHLKKLYGVPPASLPEWRRKMNILVNDINAKVPGAQLSYYERELAAEDIKRSIRETARSVDLRSDIESAGEQIRKAASETTDKPSADEPR